MNSSWSSSGGSLALSLDTACSSESPARAEAGLLVALGDPTKVGWTRSLLAEAGWSAQVVVGGAGALTQATRQHHPVVVLVDVAVLRPGLVDELRTLPGWPEVVAMAPAGASLELARTIEDGAVAGIAADCSPRELAAVLERAQELQKRRRVGSTLTVVHCRQGTWPCAARRHFEAELARLRLSWRPLWAPGFDLPIGYRTRADMPAVVCPAASDARSQGRRLGLEVDLDLRLIRSVAAELRSIRPEGDVFLELSGAMLADELLGSPGDPLLPFARQVVLELAGDEAPLRGEDLRPCLQRLRAAGYRLAIGGLGSCRDFLARLLTLEPEIHELHRQAWEGCGQNHRKHAHVADLVSVVKGEGAQVLATGVYTDQEVDLVQELGCDIVCGDYFGPSLPEPWWPGSTAHLQASAS